MILRALRLFFNDHDNRDNDPYNINQHGWVGLVKIGIYNKKKAPYQISYDIGFAFGF